MTAIGVLGTGEVGQAIARRAVEVGHEVTVGARSAESQSLRVFDDDNGLRIGSFADAARSASVVVNATNGAHAHSALSMVGSELLHGRVVVDVSNELRPAPEGFPVPTATAASSVGARLQQAFPDAHLVKTLNTMNHRVMVNPECIPGDHVAFLSGDDDAAKESTRSLLATFGWRFDQLIDLGGIETAAAAEMMMAIWMRVTLARGPAAPRFNWAILDAVR